ncbi:PREDICTED: far upstream element-binding protein 1 isoform X1 [Dufourea novaeangliae]|uniref:far upstream element-binding protein 1 isoform X1 n=1 Tax=Dufourea novaeangliae TaxID=178035 RepID=UPI000766F60C|nr:PREDICTED: far upstream element-binding protein 1 isoform X1 [Dufourea novaeangliae]
MSDYSAVAPPQNFSQSSAFAAALQRAKQIAAKINPAGAQTNPDTKLKRPLEDGSEPEAKKMASLVTDSLIGLRGPPGGNSLGDSSSQSGRASQAGSSGPIGNVGGICNEDIRVPDKMVGLIIGRGGEQITRLQSETGCKIQMAPESGGLPERVCTLTGSREAVNRAKELVLSIVNQRSRTEGIADMNMSGSGGSGMMGGHPGLVEIMIPGPKVGLIIGKGGETIKQLQEKSGAKMVVIQEGPSQEQEKPLRITGDPQKVDYAKQLVYELIAEKEIQMFHRGSRSSERSGNYSNENSFNHGSGTTDGVEVLVPRAAVGVVIGKGGDMIKKIQAETGARVQFQQGREDGPGDRKCILSGKHQAVEQVRQRIQELIDSVMRRDDGRGGGNMGARTSGPRGNGFGGNRNPNEYGGWDRRQGGPMQDKVETTFTVPSSKCGIIIGKGGETIKQINQQTGAHCELDRRNQSNENEKIFIIRGNPEQVEHAKRIFSEKLGMAPANPSFTGAQGAIGYNPTWNAGTAYQAWPNQPQTADTNAANQAPVQVNPQTGQPDYSAQWAEYYRSLGMHREADMIEQQAKQGKPEHNPQSGEVLGNAQNQPNAPAPGTPGPAQQQQPTQQVGATQNGGQADYSAQWAEYYRSIGKIKEAEAIEAQMKAGKLGMQNNQIAQQQMQQNMQGQSGPTGAAPNAFPQAYGNYPTINPGSTPVSYYAPAGAGSTSQPQAGQQNPSFPTGYQNYPYSQSNTES